MKLVRMRMTACAAMAALMPVGVIAAGWSLPEGADVHPAYRGQVPAKSDVIASTRFKRPDSVQMVRDFGANRVEWVYADDKSFIQALKGVVPYVGAAINTTGSKLPDTGMSKDFDGNTINHPRMKTWAAGGQMPSSAHPDTQKAFLAQARMYLDAGADAIQFDNPTLQLHSTLYFGGDFNESQLRGFPAYVKQRVDPAAAAAAGLTGFNGDYREFLREKHRVKNAADYAKRFRTFPSTAIWLRYIQDGVGAKYKEFRAEINKGRAKPVPVSMNLSALYEPSESNRFFFLGAIADYAIAETHIDDRPQLLSQAATARALGIGWVPSIRPLTLAENRASVATLYALGGQPLVPWDVYTGNDDSGKGQRYFGKPAEYSDIYSFVRANKALLDGMETTAVVGIPVAVDRFRDKLTKQLVSVLSERQIPFAFVMLGGTSTRYHADGARLKRYKVLVSPNADADFAPDDLKALNDSKVRRMGLADLRGGVLEELQPFIAAPGGETLKLYPRAAPGDSTRLVLHVVDSARGAQAPEGAACKRRVGISNQLLDPAKVASVRWVSPAGSVDVKADNTARGTFVTLPGCPLWGIVDLRLTR